jgi:4-alpha-glucanotransferase
MVVLQFAWGGGPSNVHLPHMHEANMFVYTGTHDNETSVGWFAGSATPTDKAYIRAYLGSEGKDIAWDLIRAAMGSVARTCIMPLQDVMRLDNGSRMNTPGVAAGNWGWRVGDSSTVWQTLKEEAEELKRMAYVYNRSPKGVRVQI